MCYWMYNSSSIKKNKKKTLFVKQTEVMYYIKQRKMFLFLALYSAHQNGVWHLCVNVCKKIK